MPKMTPPTEGLPPSMAEIGRALDLSRQAVHALHLRGMPVFSVEAAHAWRLAHLDPARRKAGDFDRELSIRQRLAQAQALMSAAADALAGGNEPAFTALVPALREAMRSIPEAARDRLLIDFAVMDRLVSPVRGIVEECESEDRAQAAAAGTAPPESEPCATEGEAARMGAFWYAIAAGEGLAQAFRHIEEEGASVAA
jgi:hypothetical protein